MRKASLSKFIKNPKTRAGHTGACECKCPGASLKPQWRLQRVGKQQKYQLELNEPQMIIVDFIYQNRERPFPLPKKGRRRKSCRRKSKAPVSSESDIPLYTIPIPLIILGTTWSMGESDENKTTRETNSYTLYTSTNPKSYVLNYKRIEDKMRPTSP